MSRRRNLIPNLLEHPSGRAYCRWQGHCYYFGPYDSPESIDAFRRWCAELLASGSPPASEVEAATLTVKELAARYLEHVAAHYKSRHVAKVTDLLNLTIEIYGTLRASEFGPSKLRTVRAKLVSKGLAPSTINQRATLLRKMFKWAVGWELIPASTAHALSQVESLPEPFDPVLPAPEHDITLTLLKAPENIRVMCEILLLTAMRTGEVCKLNGLEIHRDKPVKGLWLYAPVEHKCAHHGHKREILIGPKAQAILTPWLAAREPGEYVFRPADSYPWATKPGRPRPIGPRYCSEAFAKAVYRACELAGVPHWSPGQLRHNAASRLEDEFGPDIARKILGHRTLQTTRRYVDDDLLKAAEAMRRVG